MHDEELIPFLRNSHIFGFLVREIFEDGYLRAARNRASFVQMNILKFLALPGQHTINEVARFLSVSQPAASKAISRLKRAKLVETVPLPGDRRFEIIGLTALGKKEIQKYEQLKMARVKKLVARLGDAKVREFTQNLGALIQALIQERDFVGNFCARCGAYYAPDCVGAGKTCPLKNP